MVKVTSYKYEINKNIMLIVNIKEKNGIKHLSKNDLKQI